jgi:hypothetical protein
VSDLKLTVTHWGTVALDKRELRKLMRAAGNDIKNKTGRLINQSQGSGRQYGSHRASAPGQPPTRLSGDLRSSLKTYPFKTGEGFAVRARAKYATPLEVGAFGGARGRGHDHRKASAPVRKARAKARGQRREMEPRPFLDRVMTQEEPELNRRVRKALENALTWKETKAP